MRLKSIEDRIWKLENSLISFLFLSLLPFAFATFSSSSIFSDFVLYRVIESIYFHRCCVCHPIFSSSYSCTCTYPVCWAVYFLHVFGSVQWCLARENMAAAAKFNPNLMNIILKCVAALRDFATMQHHGVVI